LRRNEKNSTPTSLVPIQTRGNRSPLFCVHGVGGHILPFLQLVSLLDPDQPVYGLQARPIREDETEERTIEGMASQYIKEIEQVQPSGPYYLTGFSFGGFLAFEMARQITAKGKDVALLAILDTQARVLPGYRKALSTSAYAHYVVKSMVERIKRRLIYSRQQSLEKSDGDVGRQKSKHLSYNEIILGDVAEEEVPSHLKAVMQANLSALARYVPNVYPGKLILFKSLNHGKGVHYGWGELVNRGVEDHYIPGSHRGILQQPNVAILAEQLQTCIDNSRLS